MDGKETNSNGTKAKRTRREDTKKKRKTEKVSVSEIISLGRVRFKTQN